MTFFESTIDVDWNGVFRQREGLAVVFVNCCLGQANRFADFCERTLACTHFQDAESPFCIFDSILQQIGVDVAATTLVAKAALVVCFYGATELTRHSRFRAYAAMAAQAGDLLCGAYRSGYRRERVLKPLGSSSLNQIYGAVIV